MKKFAELVLAWRWPILAAFIVILAFSIHEARDMRINNAVRIYFVSDDPNLADYDRFEETFGGDEFVVIALKDERGVFNTRDLEIIRDIGTDLAKIDGVSRVASITDSVDVWGTTDGIVIEKLTGEIPRSDKELAELRTRVFSNPLFIGTLISEDATTALITARLEQAGSMDQERPRIVGEVRAVAEKYETLWGDTLYVAGIPVLNVDMNALTFRDLNVFIPLTIFLNIFVLYFLMGRWSTSILSTLSMASSVIISMGIYNALGFTMSLITTMVPPLVMVIGVSDSIHITSHYLDDIGAGMDRRAAVVETIGLLGTPCLMTAITTIVGFSSFLFAKIVPLREIGLFSGLGLSIAYILNVTFVPIALSLMPRPKPRAKAHRAGGIIDRLTAAICRFDLRHPVPILIVGALLFAVSVFFITRITVETQNLDYLKKGQPLRYAYGFIEKNFGHISPVEVVIAGEPGSAHDPRTLVAVEKFQRFVLTDPNVSTSVAATDLIKRLNMAFFNNDPERYSIPDSREGVAQLLLLYETSQEGELDYFVNFDASELRVSVRGGRSDLQYLQAAHQEVRRLLFGKPPRGADGARHRHNTALCPHGRLHNPEPDILVHHVVSGDLFHPGPPAPLRPSGADFHHPQYHPRGDDDGGDGPVRDKPRYRNGDDRLGGHGYRGGRHDPFPQPLPARGTGGRLPRGGDRHHVQDDRQGRGHHVAHPRAGLLVPVVCELQADDVFRPPFGDYDDHGDLRRPVSPAGRACDVPAEKKPQETTGKARQTDGQGRLTGLYPAGRDTMTGEFRPGAAARSLFTAFPRSPRRSAGRPGAPRSGRPAARA